MESTGAPGRIQISQATADLLIGAGKSSWLEQRSEIVRAKGKGYVDIDGIDAAALQHFSVS